MLRKVVITLVSSLLLSIVGARGQNMAIGSRVPSMNPAEWYGASLSVHNEPVLVEFFHTTNRTADQRAAELARVAKKYDERLKIVVVTVEPRELIEDLLNTTSGYFVAIDTNRKIFTSFGVRYVPYSVIIDSRGRLAWIGNSATLTDAVIEEHLNK